MDPIRKGLILGAASLLLVLAATVVLGGLMEQGAMRPVDETYLPSREDTVDAWGIRRVFHADQGPAEGKREN